MFYSLYVCCQCIYTCVCAVLFIIYIYIYIYILFFFLGGGGDSCIYLSLWCHLVYCSFTMIHHLILCGDIYGILCLCCVYEDVHILYLFFVELYFLYVMLMSKYVWVCAYMAISIYMMYLCLCRCLYLTV